MNSAYKNESYLHVCWKKNIRNTDDGLAVLKYVVSTKGKVIDVKYDQMESVQLVLSHIYTDLYIRVAKYSMIFLKIEIGLAQFELHKWPYVYVRVHAMRMFESLGVCASKSVHRLAVIFGSEWNIGTTIEPCHIACVFVFMHFIYECANCVCTRH